MKICLDFGHRNNSLDFGATNGKVKESELALAIGLKLQEQLAQQSTVILTRESEKDITSLADRCRIANDNDVDLFISIHINSADNKQAKGIEVLHYQGEAGKAIATKVCNSICDETGAVNRGAKVRNDLVVLNSTKMTAILIECGFISNTEEVVNLQNEDYQIKIVKGIVEGIGLKFINPKDTQLIEAVDKLVDKNIISSPEMWNDMAKIRPELIDALLLKYVKSVLTYDDAISILVKNKVISSEQIWFDKNVTQKNCRDLIVKLGK